MLLIPNTFTVISAVQMQQSCCKCVKVYLTHLECKSVFDTLRQCIQLIYLQMFSAEVDRATPSSLPVNSLQQRCKD